MAIDQVLRKLRLAPLQVREEIDLRLYGSASHTNRLRLPPLPPHRGENGLGCRSFDPVTQTRRGVRPCDGLNAARIQFGNPITDFLAPKQTGVFTCARIKTLYQRIRQRRPIQRRERKCLFEDVSRSVEHSQIILLDQHSIALPRCHHELPNRSSKC